MAAEVREYKQIGGHVVDCKERRSTVGGIKVGVIEGYIAAWTLDRGRDRFDGKGTFAESIAEYVASKRQARFKDSHVLTVGGYLPTELGEDSTGLFGTAEVNLEIPDGFRVHSLAKQNVLVDKSVGFTALEWSFQKEDPDDEFVSTRVITKAKLWEGSIVDEPMNPDAAITSVKAFGSSFEDLPVAGENDYWSIKGDDAGYIAEGDEGRRLVVPELLEKRALAIIESGDPSIAEVRQIEHYMAKARMDSPFPGELRGFASVKDVQALTPREFEGMLRKSGLFSRGAAKILAERYEGPHQADDEDSLALQSILDDMKAATKQIGTIGVA